MAQSQDDTGRHDGLPELPPAAFGKADTDDDLLFYKPARLVTHIDPAATAALTQFYATLLHPGDRVLDLMSSWVSHLPAGLPLGEVVGHGMNAAELAANPRLTRSFVQNLNRSQVLPLDDAGFDAALCCVGVQYLQHPVAIFTEVLRTLKPGAAVVVSFSNRCFPTKAVAIWRALDPAGQADLVRLYLERAGFADLAAHTLVDGRRSDPLWAVVGRRPLTPAP